MRVLVDANILIASLIRESTTMELMLSGMLELFAPEIVLREIEKYSDEISIKTHLTPEETKKLLKELIEISQTRIVEFSQFAEFEEKAEKISPDEKDIHYFAFALKLDCPIWSNDKKLKEQNRVKVYSTKEILELLK